MISLREARVEQLLSIRDLARRASIAPSTVYLIEAGRTSPKLHVIRSLASVLDIDPSEVDEFRLALEALKAPPVPRSN